MDKLELLGLFPQELGEALADMKLPAYRVKQLFSWLHRGARFEEMTNISKPLRETLAQNYADQPVSLLEQRVSKLDGTRKLLYALRDGNCVEGVLMHYHHGYTLCLSTQVGCRMGCAFCASTLNGCVRSLSAAEMLGQVHCANRLIADDHISNIVLMGSGEPLDNYRNVLDFLTILSSPEGRNLSLRHVSLSTCGLCDRIDELAELGLGLTLSISLHAADDETRSGIMPVNKQYNIARLMQSCKNYFAKTGRRISYEYALIAGVNDSPAHAGALARLLGGQNCHVNLIPVNPVAERGTKRPDKGAVQRFAARLGALGLNATVRRELGSDIAAACGQLRRAEAGKAGDGTK